MNTILSASAESPLASEDPVLANHQIVAAGVTLCTLVVVKELDAAPESRLCIVQEALHYLRIEVPPRAQTAPMYNSLLEAAQHSGNSKIAEQALQLMEEAEVAPNSRTVCAALRLLVGCPASPLFGLSLLRKWNQSAGCVAHAQAHSAP